MNLNRRDGQQKMPDYSGTSEIGPLVAEWRYFCLRLVAAYSFVREKENKTFR